MNYEMPEAIPPGVSVDVHMKLANDQWKKAPAIGAFMSWFYKYVTMVHGTISSKTMRGRISGIFTTAPWAGLVSCLPKFY